MSVQIIVDSAADMPQKVIEQEKLTVVPLRTIFGNEEYLDGVTITAQQFYEKLLLLEIIWILTERKMKVTEQERFMKEAIRQAKKAEALEEVPIGCVIVHEGKIIARGYNRRNTDKNTLSHAELNAIRKASKKLGDWRLEGCTMYVTLEPCQMCSGALVQSRIDEVVIGCMNAKAGCAGSVMNLLQVDGFNHQVKITQGVLEEECSVMLSEFFRRLREKKKQEKTARKAEQQKLEDQQIQEEADEE